MDALFPVVESLYYNVSLAFVLYQCNIYSATPQTDPEDPDVLWEDDEEDVFESRSSEPSLWDHMKQFFGFSANQTDSVEEPREDAAFCRNECVKILDLSQEHSLNARALITWTGVALTTCMVAIVLWLLVHCLLKYLHRDKRKHNISSCPKKETASSEDFDSCEISESHVDVVSTENLEPSEKNQLKSLYNKAAFPLLIFKSPSKVEAVKLNTTDAKDFLASTVDKFLRELDNALGISSDSIQPQAVSLNPVLNTSASSGAISNLASPRLHRRSTWRRPRHGSPSLPLGDLSLLGDSQGSKDRFVWNEIEKMNTRLGWSLSQRNDVDFGNVVNRSLKDALTFHIRNCPISNGQLTAASLLVNYLLLLLEKELLQTKDSCFRFVEFKGIGSVAKGLKISKSNQFDVAMIIQPTDCTLHNVLYHSVSEDIPSGKVLLTVKDVKQDKRQKTYTKRASVVDSIGTYLLPKEVLAMSKDLIDQALQRIMNGSKSLMDRLPFSIRTSADTDLQLILDTRMLHGLGLGIPEIGIRLCPALPLINSNLSLLPTLYAVTPWVVQVQKRRPSSSSSMRIFRDRVEGLDPDLLWSLSFCDLESSYLSAMDQKLQLAGITGCHRICLKIIKALFTSGYKTSLLSRGEIQSYQLETILFFLLLESVPSNWSMDRLADRVSDCVHFLRSALQSMWLPSFFVHNPHLEKQMPAMQLYPLLSGGRQDNLLANMKSETVEKVLNFIEQRLSEAGLEGCIKEDYSSDMWEYEFFIFG